MVRVCHRSQATLSIRFFDELAADYPEDGSPKPVNLLASDIARWCKGLISRDSTLKSKIEENCKSR